MSDNNNGLEFASPLSWPSMLCSGMLVSAVFLILQTSYSMGVNSGSKGSQNYLRAFWALVCALGLLSSALAIVKFVD
jgi:hypothetical protein